MVTSRRRLGDFGERVAAHRLESIGMRVIERNVRVGRIEIDIVAADGDDVVFVEVRTRRGGAAAAESLVPAKLQRMWQAAIGYCETRAIDPQRARIDVVAIDLEPDGSARSIEHFRGIEIPEAPE